MDVSVFHVQIFRVDIWNFIWMMTKTSWPALYLETVTLSEISSRLSATWFLLDENTPVETSQNNMKENTEQGDRSLANGRWAKVGEDVKRILGCVRPMHQLSTMSIIIMYQKHYY